MVILKTTLGDITLELDPARAPISVENFLGYVDRKFYNGTIFHRVIGDFMIQGGGFTADFVRKPTEAAIRNEAANGLKNSRGTVAMAPTSDADSATSQFFINVVDNGGLDHPRPDGHGYAVFGRVVEGMDIVDKIRAVKTGIRDGMRDVPQEPVEILSAARAAADG